MANGRVGQVEDVLNVLFGGDRGASGNPANEGNAGAFLVDVSCGQIDRHDSRADR